MWTRPARGFTLIEVMIALMIFSMAAIVLGGAYLNVISSYKAASVANEDDQAVAFARSQLLSQPDLQTAVTGAEFDDASTSADGAPTRHVKWSATIDSTDTTDLFSVTFVCELSDPSLAQPKKVTETFMLLRPTWSDPATRSNLRQAAASRIAQVQGRPPSQ